MIMSDIEIVTKFLLLKGIKFSRVESICPSFCAAVDEKKYVICAYYIHNKKVFPVKSICNNSYMNLKYRLKCLKLSAFKICCLGDNNEN